MSTSKEYMQFVLDQLKEFPDVTYRKMFGEYMVYLQGRPVLLVCDNCAMVKKLPELAELMRGAPDGLPYEGARVHSVLDLCHAAAEAEKVTMLAEKSLYKARNL